MKRSLMTGVALAAVLATTAAQAAESNVAMQYHLPKTTPVITAVLTLKACGKDPVVEADVNLAVRADASPAAYKVYGEGLKSWRVKRDFTLTVDDQGRLKTLNSDAEDRVGAIIGNALKFVLSVAKMSTMGSPTAGPMSVDESPPPPTKDEEQCSDAALRAISRAAAIRTQVRTLRAFDATQGAAIDDPSPRLDTIAALTAELAALESGPLRLTLSGDVDLGATHAAGQKFTAAWTSTAYEDWFKPGESMVGRIRNQLNGLYLTETSAAATPAVTPKKPVSCGLFMPTPEPLMVRFDLHRQDGQTVSSVRAPVQQWGQIANLCLDVGFFATRKLEISWDQFGMMTSFHWGSNARAEAVTETLAASAEGYAKYRDEHQPDSATAVAGAQADLAEAKIRAIKAERCLALLQAGGACED